MGGAPIISLFREALPAARPQRFRGILNSTTNLVLTEMEHGNRFEAAVKKAQDLGIAETDPSFDVDGWDATVKLSALATVLTLAPLGSRPKGGPALAAGATSPAVRWPGSTGVDYPLKPNDIAREGIRGLGME
jgi:hypothetical protein